MAYLSENNADIYRRMLSANDEREPGTTGSGTSFVQPPPRTAAPTPIKKNFGVPGTPLIKGVSVTGTTTAPTATGVTADVAVMPKSFQQAATMMITPTPEKRNFMPLVYIGGAGLLLYFLFKK